MSCLGDEIKANHNDEEYIKYLYEDIIGNNIRFKTPYGNKYAIYADFTASGRGVRNIEDFISNQILPFYANVHSTCGYFAEQSENFRNEAKSIVRRYINSDEKDCIIFTGHGTTACINKLIKIMNLKEYVNFYNELKNLYTLYEENKEDFLNKYSTFINLLNEKHNRLFKISNFCYLNRWRSYDCILCRMVFKEESQYNDHEKSSIHKSNIEKCSQTKDTIFYSKYSQVIDMIINFSDFEPIVFLSIYEHNSNVLTWREAGARIIYIDYMDDNLDFNYLENELKNNYNKIIKIGSFTASSNISGIYLDTDQISILLHKYNSLAFFDYATAAPYIKIDMNKMLNSDIRKKMGFDNLTDDLLAYKDAIFFSPHKFLGGPNTPGVLIIKQHIVRNLLVPSEPGGGVVLFVSKNSQNYVRNIEAREESGTPDIIGSVRIGLTLLLRERIDHSIIIDKDHKINTFVYKRLENIPSLILLGKKDFHKIPIFSFIIKFSGKILHYNFVSALLNDLFGIQSRGGCSCASTYGQKCLGIDDEYIQELESLVCNGLEIFRPGYTRINFPYFYPQYLIEYITNAIEFIAKYGWLFLSHYAFNIESGKYYHRKEEEEKRKWLNQIEFKNGKINLPTLVNNKNIEEMNELNLNKILDEALEIVNNIESETKHLIGSSKVNHKIMFLENERNRWFLLPDEIEFIDKDKQKEVSQFYTQKLDIRFKIDEISNGIISKNITNELIYEEKEEKYIEKVLDYEINTNILENNKIESNLFPEIPKKILRLVSEASIEFDMLHDGDRILIGLSGGKDSLSLLHIMLHLQKKLPFKIDIAGITVDPQSNDYNPSSLIDYTKKLGVKYFYESDPILERAKKSLQKDSICAFCARMKRGIIYNCARREGYNVIALGQHLDDLAESFLMSSFHNGLLRTMKANYIIDQGDLRVIRPLIFCREKLFKEFTLKYNIPVIQENCPACFSAPKERHRIKVLLAQQENLFPNLFSSIMKSMKPLMKGVFEGEKKDDIDI